MKQRLLLILILPALTFSSCATLLNKRYGTVEFKVSDTVNYVFEGDTIVYKTQEPLPLTVRKKSIPLNITVFNDSISKTLAIRPIKSKLFWGNVLTASGFFVGFLVDEISNRKFTYPKRIFVDLNKPGNSYLPYYPMFPDLIAAKNKISLTPIAALGFTHPGIEASYQRLHGDHFASQVSFSYLISKNTDFARDSRGFKLGLEEKYYLRNASNERLYLSLSLEYFRKQHSTAMEFVLTGSDPFFDPPFTSNVTVRKRFVSLTPRIGFEHYLSKKLVLDMFFGVGLRYRETDNVGVPANWRMIDPFIEWFDIRTSSNRPHTGMSANLDLNLRIGWVF